MVYFRLKCEYLGIDIQDDMGRHEVGFVENTVKTPLMIAPDKEGCLFEAKFNINKVSSKKLSKATFLLVQSISRCLEISTFQPILWTTNRTTMISVTLFMS